MVAGVLFMNVEQFTDIFHSAKVEGILVPLLKQDLFYLNSAGLFRNRPVKDFHHAFKVARLQH